VSRQRNAKDASDNRSRAKAIAFDFPERPKQAIKAHLSVGWRTARLKRRGGKIGKFSFVRFRGKSALRAGTGKLPRLPRAFSNFREAWESSVSR
jgi:hypothetical protein